MRWSAAAHCARHGQKRQRRDRGRAGHGKGYRLHQLNLPERLSLQFPPTIAEFQTRLNNKKGGISAAPEF